MIYPFNAPLLDLLILSILSRQDNYGYEISQQLKGVSGMKDSTLYPILKRLSDNLFVTTYDQPFQGRNRKYYRITNTGQKQLAFLYQEWLDYSKAIEKIINREIVSQRGGKHE